MKILTNKQWEGHQRESSQAQIDLAEFKIFHDKHIREITRQVHNAADQKVLEIVDKLTDSEAQRKLLQSQLDQRFPSLGPDTLTEKQLNQFFQCDKTLPLWRGVMEIVNRACRFAAQRAATENMDDNIRAHCAGGLEWAMDIHAELTSRQEKAVQNENEEK